MSNVSLHQHSSPYSPYSTGARRYFVFTDGETKALLESAVKYKKRFIANGVPWVSVREKYEIIANDLIQSYAEMREKDPINFCHDPSQINRYRVQEKLKTVRKSFRKSLVTREACGRTMVRYFDLCTQLWGQPYTQSAEKYVSDIIGSRVVNDQTYPNDKQPDIQIIEQVSNNLYESIPVTDIEADVEPIEEEPTVIKTEIVLNPNAPQNPITTAASLQSIQSDVPSPDLIDDSTSHQSTSEYSIPSLLTSIKESQERRELVANESLSCLREMSSSMLRIAHSLEIIAFQGHSSQNSGNLFPPNSTEQKHYIN